MFILKHKLTYLSYSRILNQSFLALCQVCLKLDHWLWRRKFFNFVNDFLLFRNYLPLEKGLALYLKKLESHLPKNVLCQVWLKLARCFLRWRFFKISSIYFKLFRNYLHLEKGVSLHFSFIQRFIVPSLVEMAESGFGEEDFKFYCIFSKCSWNWPNGFWDLYFRYFVIISP